MIGRPLVLKILGALAAVVLLAATSSGIAAFELANDPCSDYASSEEGPSDDGVAYGHAWWPPFAPECEVMLDGRSFTVGLVDWYDAVLLFAGQLVLLFLGLRRRRPSPWLAGAVAAAAPIGLAGLGHLELFDYVPTITIALIYGLPLLAVAAYVHRRVRPDRPSIGPLTFAMLGMFGLMIFAVLALLPLASAPWFLAIGATAALAATGERTLRRLNLRS